MPPPPPLSEHELAAAERPPSVDTAFKTWIGAAIVGLIGQVLALLTQDQVIEETRKQLEAQGLPTQGLDAGAGSGIASFVFGVILIGVWIAVVFAMRNGANWARILLTVLGVLAVLVSVFTVLLGVGILFSVGILGVLQVLLALAELVLIVLAIVFMFKADASRYFKRA